MIKFHIHKLFRDKSKVWVWNAKTYNGHYIAFSGPKDPTKEKCRKHLMSFIESIHRQEFKIFESE